MGDGGFALKYAINFAWIRAEEGKSTDALAANNGLEEKRGRFLPNLRVSAEWCLAVGGKIQIDWYGVTLSSQRVKFGSGGFNLHLMSVNFERRILNVESFFMSGTSSLAPITSGRTS